MQVTTAQRSIIVTHWKLLFITENIFTMCFVSLEPGHEIPVSGGINARLIILTYCIFNDPVFFFCAVISHRQNE